MSNWRIPLSDILLGEEEVQAVAEVVRSRWLTAGAKTAELERAFAVICQTRYAFAVSNCTAALELGLAALEVGPGDEVIVPSLTFVATANAVRAVGATPVFADITSEDDLNLDPEDVASKISPRTRAVIAVHYGGYPARVDLLAKLCQERGLHLIEDCAHAPGATLGQKPLGSFGALGCFSFFGNKNMTTGEGGMIVTDSPELAETLRLLRSHGMTTGTWDRYRGHASVYDVVRVGHNARFDDLRAALGLVQLGRLFSSNARRGELVRRYRQKLRGVSIPFADREESSFHLMVVLLPEGTERTLVMAKMKEKGIQTSVHYPPVHLFSVYAGEHSLPRLERIAPRLLTLPLYPTLSESQVDEVADALAEALGAI